MPVTFSTREVQVNDESTFCENDNAPGSNSYATRLPVTDCKVTLTEERIADASVQSRLNHGQGGFRGCRRAEIELTMMFGGHGTTCAGALAETALQALLGDALGGQSTAAVGTTVKTAGDADTFTGNASSGWAAGMIGRVGTISDARGKGQPFVVNTVLSDVFESLVALPAAPQANDVIYATQLAYPTETLGTSKRFLVGWAETGAQYHLMGCSCAGITVNTEFGKPATITFKYVAAYWDRSAVTIPSAVSMSANDCAPVAAGSVTLQTVGTSARTAVVPFSMKLEIGLGLEEIRGPGATAAYRDIVEHVRTATTVTLELVLPWATAYEDLWNSDGSSSVYKHVLVGLNPSDGRAAGWYCPSMHVDGPRPTLSESNGLNAVVLRLKGREGPTTTNDLTRSVIRFFMG